MIRKATTDSSRVSLGKKLLFWLVILAIPIVALEFGVRTYFAFQLGSSMLFYGTRLNREKGGDAHSGDMHILDGYFKYHPHEERFTRDKESGRLIRASINSSGFRGPDFTQQKDPNVTRVITLGASSTFGFSDRDDETYPYYLERLLNREAPRGHRFEVINFGIPHLKSEQILALFKTEGLALHPDVVTFYEGVNDTWRSRVLFKKTSRGPGTVRTTLRRSYLLHRSFTWLRDHFITIVIADGFLKRRKGAKFNAADVEVHMRGKSEEFVKNVSAIYDVCKRNDITFIVGGQQAKSLTLDMKHMKGVTYEEEVDIVRRMLAEKGYINADQLNFLTHAALMHDLREWIDANNVPYADVIAAMDQRRDCLVSWVHLNAEGNLIVAGTFARAILRDVGSKSAARVDTGSRLTH
jgi:hypothetical protein